MTIEIKKNAAETTIEIVGRLDTMTAPTLEKTINNELFYHFILGQLACCLEFSQS